MRQNKGRKYKKSMNNSNTNVKKGRKLGRNTKEEPRKTRINPDTKI